MAHVMGSPVVDKPSDYIVDVGVGSRSLGRMVGRGCTSLRLPSCRLLGSVRCLYSLIASDDDLGCCRVLIWKCGGRSLGCRVPLDACAESEMSAEADVSERPSLILEIVWNARRERYRWFLRPLWVCDQAPVVHRWLDDSLLLAVIWSFCASRHVLVTGVARCSVAFPFPAACSYLLTPPS